MVQRGGKTGASKIRLGVLQRRAREFWSKGAHPWTPGAPVRDPSAVEPLRRGGAERVWVKPSQLDPQSWGPGSARGVPVGMGGDPRASPNRLYCGQHIHVQGASTPAAPAVDVSNVKGSDEDGYLSRNVTTKANNKTLKELSEFGSTLSPARLRITLCTQTLALRCTTTV